MSLQVLDLDDELVFAEAELVVDDDVEHDEAAALDVRELVLSTLPPMARLAIVLHYWEGLSIMQVARTLGYSRRRTQALLHDARLRLRLALTNCGYGQEAFGYGATTLVD